MFRKSVWIDLVEPVVCLRGQPNDKQTINILRGVVRLQLSHSAIVHSVMIQFIGISKTLWPEGKLYCFYKLMKLTSIYLSIYLYTFFLKKKKKKASQHWDKHVLVDSVIPVCKNVFLKKGTHAFPFEILLSNALSESIECGLGSVRYKLLCRVHVQPRFLLIKSLLQTQRPIVLIRLPTLENQQQCITQTHVINDSGGQLNLAIEKSYLVPGIQLPISFYFNQPCTVEQITVKLVERQKYRASSKQSTRILHHEIVLSPLRCPDQHLDEIRTVYVVPDKHTLKVRASTSHYNIRVRHWIQIYLKLILRDGTTKDLQMDAPISVLLESVDQYLALPVYDIDNVSQEKELNTTKSLSTLTSTFIASSYHPLFWLQKIYPMKQTNRLDANKSLQQRNNSLMKLMTAPPPLYEDVISSNNHITPNLT
jgi:hypothetical protein